MFPFQESLPRPPDLKPIPLQALLRVASAAGIAVLFTALLCGLPLLEFLLQEGKHPVSLTHLGPAWSTVPGTQQAERVEDKHSHGIQNDCRHPSIILVHINYALSYPWSDSFCRWETEI